MADAKKIVIFYSWQTDSPKKTNLNAIREALKAAESKISKTRPGLKLVLDEATRGTSGSPNIAAKILEKIQAADIVIADITTITPSAAPRPCPNPNVGYELGYAVAEVGWDRIILLFNEAIGQFPKDIPFDFLQNRTGRYKFTDTDLSSARKPLDDLLTAAILAVIDVNPKRPAELRGLTPEKIKHDNDVKNMDWVMSKIHLPTLDEHILELPHMITARALTFSEMSQPIVNSSLFNLYDPVLKSAVHNLFSSWQIALSHDAAYHDIWGGQAHVFTNPLDLPLGKRKQQIWDGIDKARTQMRAALDEILQRLREGYIEIDIHKTNDRAWKSYAAIQQYVNAGSGQKPKKKAKGKKTKTS
jgi:hypothetical protein